MKTIVDAKRLIAATSAEGMRILGAGVSKPCAPARYNNAATAALADPNAELTLAERKLIASFIEPEDDESREFMLRVRLTESERARLNDEAESLNMTMSELVRQKLFQ